MTYLLVMGGVMLSVLFTLGWLLFRLLRLAGGALPGGRRSSVRKPAKGRAKAARPAAKSKGKAAANKAASTRAAPAKLTEKPPWRLTQRLAQWHAALPLALVLSLIYLAARLAEHGMSFRPPHTVPGGYQVLVAGLGWLAALLIGLALVQRVAMWRCR